MRKIWMSNRYMKKQPKQGKYWCGCCDANHVYDWQKCKVCGHRNGIKRNKKG